MSEELFMVLKLETHMISEDLFGNKVKVTVEGCKGFAPIFATWDEAYKASQDGKFEIMKLTT